MSLLIQVTEFFKIKSSYLWSEPKISGEGIKDEGLLLTWH